MLLTRKRKFLQRISVATVQILLVIFFIIFIVFPFVFRYSITLQRGILFLTFITYPKDLDLNKPESLGLHGTRNFFITVKDPDETNEHSNDVRIGAWHVLPLYVVKRFKNALNINDSIFQNTPNSTVPKDMNDALEKMMPVLNSEFPIINSDNAQLFYERILKLPGTIVIYLHGNTACRGSGHRVDVYKLLRILNYHVLTIDYRGYGDSDPVSPTEEGVVRDALAAYQYIRNITSNPVFIWGHSLGTGVSTNLCSQLSIMNDSGPNGVILESPFTNIREEIRKHPFSRPFKHLPWFDFTISAPMYRNSLRFESDQHISEFRQPIMILHAEDDYVVPFQLGYKLYRIALDTRGKSWGPVEFHRFDGSLKYGHKYICHSPELPKMIKSFIDTYRKETY